MHASNVLEPDREQLDRFIKTLFRHAYKYGRVSIRAFVVNKGGKQTAVILDDARLGDADLLDRVVAAAASTRYCRRYRRACRR